MATLEASGACKVVVGGGWQKCGGIVFVLDESMAKEVKLRISHSGSVTSAAIVRTCGWCG